MDKKNDSIEKIATDDSETRAFLLGVGKYNDTLISLLNVGALISDIDSEF